MNSDGGRTFKTGSGRKQPERKSKENNGRSIFLADYGCTPEPADAIRFHPADRASESPLLEVLRSYGIAIGYQTSALVTAGLEGLEVICKDETNIMSEPNWLELLPYADWHLNEIASGDAWEHLIKN